MLRWEYLTLKFGTSGWLGGHVDTAELDAELNALGDDGWEVVAALDTNQSHGQSRYIVVILKRLREN